MKSIIGMLMMLIVITSCTKTSNKSSSVAPNITIGATYNNGTVFYVLQPGDKGYVANATHGFIMAKELGTYKWWSINCGNSINPNVLSPILGDGDINTDLITNLCSIQNAASVCKLSNYYLPNLAELQKVYLSGLLKGSIHTYWASEANGAAAAMTFRMLDGAVQAYPTNQQFYVLPIKKF